jgi:protein-S-isoprenylcysteine O-methyltransferase Ste14
VSGLVTALARWRVPLGFGCAVLVFWLARPTPLLLAVGAIVAAAGEALRIWAAGHLNKSREVTSSGPYRWFAHPLYVGSSVMGAGLAIASGSVLVALVIVTYLGATIGSAVRSEEAFLRGKFGAGYDAWRRGAAASAGEPARRFSVAQAMANREYRALAGAAAAMLLLWLKASL